MKSRPSAEQIRNIIDYNPDTGEFRWKNRLSNGREAGSIAGCLNTLGYWQMCILGHKCYGHRVAWMYVNGEWPGQEIDHIDGNPANNRISNLRLASRSTNIQNVTKIVKKTQSGIVGVHLTKNGKFSSKVMLNYKSINLGVFDTAEEAHTAYVAAKREIHEGNTL